MEKGFGGRENTQALNAKGTDPYTRKLGIRREGFAEQELSDQAQETAVAQLQSWNLHVFARRIIDDATGEMGISNVRLAERYRLFLPSTLPPLGAGRLM